MKYAIYDKAADGYLTKMEFEVGYSEHTQFECGYNELITEAKLLDTKEAADSAIANIEGFKFMEKGRFVVHCFDDTLNDQYIISEAGNPTKVVDNITVDLDGTINVKYGTMMSHWSSMSLNDVIDRMNALQKAVSAIYTSWNNTFDICKVITIMDEKGHTHYQFINVTAEGLEKYSKDEEVVSVNKRIEELKKANYELGEQVAERGAVANHLLDENNSLKTKVEAIKKEAHDWKELYKNADADREELKNVIDIINTDLVSSTACDNLKDTLKAINCNSGLDHISMDNFLTAKDEIRSIINHVITIMESRERNQSIAFASADEVHKARGVADDIISICEADDNFEVTLKKFSELYETIWIPGTSDDVITHAFKSILFIFATLENEVRKIIDKDVANRDSLAEVISAIRNAIYNNNSDAFRCIENRIKIDKDFNSDSFMVEVRENIKDIVTAEKKNITNNELKNSEIARLTKERDKALERAEKFKGIANSIYGMTIPVRCCGKQAFADVTTGKKILIDKKKYDDLVEWIDAINTTYDTMFFMNKPAYLPIMIEHLNDLTK